MATPQDKSQPIYWPPEKAFKITREAIAIVGDGKEFKEFTQTEKVWAALVTLLAEGQR